MTLLKIWKTIQRTLSNEQTMYWPSSTTFQKSWFTTIQRSYKRPQKTAHQFADPAQRIEGQARPSVLLIDTPRRLQENSLFNYRNAERLRNNSEIPHNTSKRLQNDKVLAHYTPINLRRNGILQQKTPKSICMHSSFWHSTKESLHHHSVLIIYTSQCPHDPIQHQENAARAHSYPTQHSKMITTLSIPSQHQKRLHTPSGLFHRAQMTKSLPCVSTNHSEKPSQPLKSHVQHNKRAYAATHVSCTKQEGLHDRLMFLHKTTKWPPQPLNLPIQNSKAVSKWFSIPTQHCKTKTASRIIPTQQSMRGSTTTQRSYIMLQRPNKHWNSCTTP